VAQVAKRDHGAGKDFAVQALSASLPATGLLLTLPRGNRATPCSLTVAMRRR